MTVVDQAQLVEPIVAKWARLEDHIEILSGFPFDSNLFSPTEGTPLIRIRDVVRGRTETHYTGTYDDKFVITDGDLLIGMDGDFNRATWSSGPALLNQRVCKVTAKPGSLDDRYLYHFLPIPLMDIWQQTPFATVKHLSVKGIRGIQIPLPPLPEQRRIAAILDKADNLRTQRREALAHLDALERSIFDSMFSTPSSTWTETRLNAVAIVSSGITKGRKTNSQTLSAYPYLAVSNVQDRNLDMSVVKEIEVTSAEAERFRLQKGDLLMTEGGDPDKLGRGTVWNDELPWCLHQNHVFRVRIADHEAVIPIFLSWFLSSPESKGYFLRMAKQTTGIASINKTQLSATPLTVPPLKLQQTFAKRVAGVERLKDQHRTQLAELDALFGSLQHRAFKGEL